MEKECCDCGELMKIRTNKDGDAFWGCTAYPECKYTESIEDEDEEGFDKNNVDYKD